MLLKEKKMLKRFMNAGPHPAVGLFVVAILVAFGWPHLHDQTPIHMFGHVVKTSDLATFGIVLSIFYGIWELLRLLGGRRG